MNTNASALTLNDVAKLFRSQTSGKTLHVNAVRRWIIQGVNGVKLEAVGGRVTWEALRRFQRAIGQRKV